ncbi:MAG: hypothetical protein FH761_11080 [Firmicutes bacterium]|nr:hypothetical protein [Bacillota bacterium]
MKIELKKIIIFFISCLCLFLASCNSSFESSSNINEIIFNDTEKENISKIDNNNEQVSKKDSDENQSLSSQVVDISEKIVKVNLNKKNNFTVSELRVKVPTKAVVGDIAYRDGMLYYVLVYPIPMSD